MQIQKEMIIPLVAMLLIGLAGGAYFGFEQGKLSTFRLGVEKTIEVCQAYCRAQQNNIKDFNLGTIEINGG